MAKEGVIKKTDEKPFSNQIDTCARKKTYY